MPMSSRSPRSPLRFGRGARRGRWKPLAWIVIPLGVIAVAVVAMRSFGPAAGEAQGSDPTPERTRTAAVDLAPPPQSARGILLEHEPVPTKPLARESAATPSALPAAVAPSVVSVRPQTAEPPAPARNPELARALDLSATDPVRSRIAVTEALDSGRLSATERREAYALAERLMGQLFLNPKGPVDDPTVRIHTIASGETLVRIVQREKLGCDWRLLQYMNGISDPGRIRVGQKLRVPVGTFHAEVSKSEYRLNLFLGEGPGRTLVATFPVGLGAGNNTPTGLFRVRSGSKLVNPRWTHPHTGQAFAADDPLNPIGEWWVGIEGVEDANRDKLGFGIHGTIEPDSIGQDRSLGCVRLVNDDVAIVYACLTEPGSTILIRP